MRRHWRWWLPPVVVLGTAIGWLSWPELSLRWHVAAVERDIAATLPPGSTQAEVQAWLDRRHLYNAFIPTARGIDQIGNETVAARAGLDADQLSGFIASQIGYSDFPFNSSRVTAYFFFDKNK